MFRTHRSQSVFSFVWKSPNWHFCWRLFWFRFYFLLVMFKWDNVCNIFDPLTFIEVTVCNCIRGTVKQTKRNILNTELFGFDLQLRDATNLYSEYCVFYLHSFVYRICICMYAYRQCIQTFPNTGMIISFML